ncbi:hypothetical protein HMPREF9211_1309 [Lactobacillus iners LactinV 01V1-a]|uniref:Uncharacterized protein n=1 Tax=Lactobacillus iners LactinV 01V1-a TaxID=879297 RepID=E1NT20_9LACO|nr:hypothetical protein HMPREF9211_1309 [Lactobacillus iners LactinV 01V1-a]
MIYLIYLTGILIVIASVCLVISMDKKEKCKICVKKMLFVAIICQLLIFTFIFIMLNTAFK